MKGYLVRPADQSGKLRPSSSSMRIAASTRISAMWRGAWRWKASWRWRRDFLSPLGGTPADEDKAREMFSQLEPARRSPTARRPSTFLKATSSATARSAPSASAGAAARSTISPSTSPDLAAGVAYYGRQPKAEDVAKIKAPLLLHYAGLDERINAGIDAFKAALNEDGKEFTIYVYDGVNHAFNNDTSEARYNKAAADLAWGRTIAFFKEKLA